MTKFQDLFGNFLSWQNFVILNYPFLTFITSSWSSMQYSVKEGQLLRNEINETKWNKYAKCNLKLFDNISAYTTKYCKQSFTFSLQQCMGSMYHNNLLKWYELLNRILGWIRRNLCSKCIFQFQHCIHHLFCYIWDHMVTVEEASVYSWGFQTRRRVDTSTMQLKFWTVRYLTCFFMQFKVILEKNLSKWRSSIS